MDFFFFIYFFFFSFFLFIKWENNVCESLEMKSDFIATESTSGTRAKDLARVCYFRRLMAWIPEGLNLPTPFCARLESQHVGENDIVFQTVEDTKKHTCHEGHTFSTSQWTGFILLLEDKDIAVWASWTRVKNRENISRLNVSHTTTLNSLLFYWDAFIFPS